MDLGLSFHCFYLKNTFYNDFIRNFYHKKFAFRIKSTTFALLIIIACADIINLKSYTS